MKTRKPFSAPSLPDGFSLLPDEPGLYVIFNRHTGRAYVGLATSRRKRCCKHLSQLRRGEHPNYKMQYDADLYGIGNFCFLPLLALLSETDAIKSLRADDLELGYNLMDGRDWTTETKLRDCEFRLIKKRQYVYLPAVNRATPVLRLFLDSWNVGQAATRIRVKPIPD